MKTMTTINNIPTNIITGFLGAGKTTAILHLLKNKPPQQRWAVLVNEFGEVGIDGSLLQAQQSEKQGLFIREVPGGCMCCAAGVPMQIALNELLKQAKPDRLLIEPTGLGHPKEVLKTLSQAHYQGVLQLGSTLTLVDARHISDSRYIKHDTFVEQLAISDIIVANKVDLYGPHDKQTLTDYLNQQPNMAATPVHFVHHGEIDAHWLTAAANVTVAANAHDHAHHHHKHHKKAQHPDINQQAMPACGYLTSQNHNGGFASLSWRFSAEFAFDLTALVALIDRLPAERIKAVFNTQQGVIGFNKTSDSITQTPLVPVQNQAPQPHGQHSIVDVLARNDSATRPIELARLTDQLLNCRIEGEGLAGI